MDTTPSVCAIGDMHWRLCAMYVRSLPTLRTDYCNSWLKPIPAALAPRSRAAPSSGATRSPAASSTAAWRWRAPGRSLMALGLSCGWQRRAPRRLRWRWGQHCLSQCRGSRWQQRRQRRQRALGAAASVRAWARARARGGRGSGTRPPEEQGASTKCRPSWPLRKCLRGPHLRRRSQRVCYWVGQVDWDSGAIGRAGLVARAGGGWADGPAGRG